MTNAERASSRPGVGVVVMSRPDVVERLTASAAKILGEAGAHIVPVGVDDHTGADAAHEQLVHGMRAADAGRGVLVFADVFDAPAAGVALALVGSSRVEVVSGASVAMLVAAAQHAHVAQDARALGEHAVRGAAAGELVTAMLDVSAAHAG